MAEFTLDDLTRVIRQCAGEGDTDMAGAAPDATFADLGYDSLALLETAAVIQHQYQVAIPEGALAGTGTLAGAVDLVNQLLMQRAG
jgi:act minimal PKS acyl carrier protein